MIRPFSASRSSRRAFARSSRMESAGVSSNSIFSLERLLDASMMAAQSASCTWPARSFDKLTRASDARTRWTSWEALISSDRNATVAPNFAALVHKFRAKAVLPTPGRAARMTRSPPRKPWNRSSTSLKPDATPEILFSCAAISCSSSKASTSNMSMPVNALDTRFSVTANSVFSACSTTTPRSSGAS